MAELRQLLYLQNPWWHTQGFSFPEASWYKREIFQKFEEYLTLSQMTAIIGLRRVGKTTLLRQAIDSLLKNNFPPTSICYFSFEEVGVNRETETLEKIVEIYLGEIGKTGVWETGKVFFFFDEIQYVPYWQNILKRYYDLNKNFKFVVSGSSSLFLRKEAKETLSGRMLEIKIPPLSFREYLAIKGEKKSIPQIDIFGSAKIPSILESLELLQIQGLFLSFLSCGQFPELLGLPDFEKKRQYLKEWVIEKIIDTDLPSIVKIEYPDMLKNLTYTLLEGSGQEIEFTNLGEDLGISRETVRQYISYLEKALLVHQVINFSGSFRRRERRNRKIYAASSNFASVVLAENEMGKMFQKNLGKIVETFVCNNLILKFAKVFFFKERGKEVDFIVGNEEEMYPMEVKFQEKARDEDYKNLLSLMEKRGYQKAFLLTKNHWGEKKIKGKTIYLRPVFLI